jgi:S-(hydroxymethyl)glutathione dehydrogenase/alcohol dehydrogenase
VRAAILHAPGTVVVEDVRLAADLQPYEVLVRTMAAGVCHSDLSYADGSWPTTYPFVLGHEGAGIVELVGSSVSYVKPGDHVSTCVSLFCGECRSCLRGRPNLCTVRPRRGQGDEPRLTLDGTEVTQLREVGAFAELMLVHVNSLAVVPDTVPFEVAALLGCGVLTGTGAVFNSARVEPGSSVAVIGCGGVGLNVVQAARMAGAAVVIAVDQVASKLELAARFGATAVVNARETDPVARVLEISDGGVDHAFEAIGRPDTAQQAVKMLGLGGTATIVGVMKAGASFEVDAWTLLRDRVVQGCTMGSNRFRLDIPMLAGLYLDGRLELDSLVSRRFALSEVQEAMDTLHSGEVARSVIVFDSHRGSGDLQ